MNYSNLWDINPNAIPTYSAETPKPEVKKTPTFANNIYSDFKSDIADKAKEADFKIDFAKDLTRQLGRAFIENSGYLGNMSAKVPNYIINDIPRAAAYAGQSIWDNPIARTVLGIAYNKYTDASNSYGNAVDKWIGGDLSADAYDSVTQEHLGDYAQPESQADLQQAAEKMNAVSGIGMGGLTAKALMGAGKYVLKYPKSVVAIPAVVNSVGSGLSAEDTIESKPIPKEYYEVFDKQPWASRFMAAFHESRQEDAKAYLIREIINSGGSLDNLEDVLPILDKMSQFKMSQEIK
jgi:hypothetical protein